MVDTDTLLEKDALTLDEALKTANTAILTAINAISILVSDMHIKFLDVPNVTMKELEVSELKKFLGAYQDAKIGFGTAYNIKTSIMRSLYECPFLSVDVKLFCRRKMRQLVVWLEQILGKDHIHYTAVIPVPYILPRLVLLGIFFWHLHQI